MIYLLRGIRRLLFRRAVKPVVYELPPGFGEWATIGPVDVVVDWRPNKDVEWRIISVEDPE